MTTDFSHSHQRSHFLLGESQGDSIWASQIRLSFASWYSLTAQWLCDRWIHPLPLLFPPGPNIWILLLLYLPTQLLLAPSSWSTNWSDPLLSKKRLSTLQPPPPLQHLWPPFPHLSIPQFFFFHHPSDFVSDADTELWVPTIMVLLRLPYPHHLPYNKKHYLCSSTWKNCPSFLLLWYYTQILSQPCWWSFLFSCIVFPEFHTHGPKWPQKGKVAERWWKVLKETEELQNAQSHRSWEMSKF